MATDDGSDPRKMPGVFPPDPVPGTANAPSLSRTVQAQLGQRLRHFYESLALGETPVPDRFIEILNRLDNVEPGGKTS